MQVNNYQSTTFGCIKIKDGGEKFLANEGVLDVNGKVNALREEFKDYKWQLEIGDDGYVLISPTTKKAYKGPFSLKKQYEKDFNNSKTGCMIVRMDERNKVRYKVKSIVKEEIRKLYSLFKKASSLDKMVILLKVLERNIRK